MGYISCSDIVWLYVPLILVIEHTESSDCPPTAKVYNTLNYCYWVHTMARKFTGADDECKTHGGRLARIPDADAKQFIEDNFNTVLSVSNAWIGVKTDDYINFTSVEGDLVTYLPWLTSYTYNGQCLLLDTAVSPYKYKEELCGSYHISLCYMSMGEITTESTTVTTTQQVQTTEQSTVPESTTPIQTTKETTIEEITTATTSILTTTQEVQTTQQSTVPESTTPVQTTKETTTVPTNDVTTTQTIMDGTTTITAEPSTKDTCLCECSTTAALNKEETKSLLWVNLGRLTNMLSSSMDSLSDILTCANSTRCKVSLEDFRSCTIMIV